MALIRGPGLPGGSSLPQFLAEHRQVRNHMDLVDFTEEEILAWADSHHERTGQWPRSVSGIIEAQLEKPGRRFTEPFRMESEGSRGGLISSVTRQGTWSAE